MLFCFDVFNAMAKSLSILLRTRRVIVNYMQSGLTVLMTIILINGKSEYPIFAISINSNKTVFPSTAKATLRLPTITALFSPSLSLDLPAASHRHGAKTTISLIKSKTRDPRRDDRKHDAQTSYIREATV